MIRPGQSSLSLRSIGNSIKNLNTISTDRLDEKILLLLPSIANMKSNDHASNANNTNVRSLASSGLLEVNNEIFKTSSLDNIQSNSETKSPNDLIVENCYYATSDNLTKVYFKRWIILFIFCFITMLSAFNWIEYNIIQDVTIAFFNASLPEDEAQKNDAVYWFSMIYMLCYIPFVFPAMFLLDRKGLKLSCILGSLLTTIGSIIKCAAVNPKLFPVAMLGQTVCALAQVFTLSVPARLSALWFGPSEIATATSIGVFGNQLGVAFGFLIPPSVVTKSDSITFMQRRFYYLLVPVATLSAISFILTLVFLKDQPDKPPSIAQLEIRNLMTRYENNTNNKESDFKLYRKSIYNLVRNLNYVLILISYGINTGVYYALGTLLNQIISEYHQNENEKIGFIGLILVLSGLIGSVIGGIILDKTKAFKMTTFVIYLCSFLAMALFTATLHINIWIIFLTSFLLGFFMTGYLPVGFELAAEVTYPEPEGTSCGLLNSSAQLFGIIYTYVQGRIITKYSCFYGNVFVTVSLLVGTIITAFVKSDLRRQKAFQRFNAKENNEENINNNQAEPDNNLDRQMISLNATEKSEYEKNLMENSDKYV